MKYLVAAIPKYRATIRLYEELLRLFPGYKLVLTDSGHIYIGIDDKYVSARIVKHLKIELGEDSVIQLNNEEKEVLRLKIEKGEPI